MWGRGVEESGEERSGRMAGSVARGGGEEVDKECRQAEREAPNADVMFSRAHFTTFLPIVSFRKTRPESVRALMAAVPNVTEKRARTTLGTKHRYWGFWLRGKVYCDEEAG